MGWLPLAPAAVRSGWRGFNLKSDGSVAEDPFGGKIKRGGSPLNHPLIDPDGDNNSIIIRSEGKGKRSEMKIASAKPHFTTLMTAIK